MLLGYLLGLEEGKLSEKERQAAEAHRRGRINCLTRTVYVRTPNACSWSRVF